MPTYPEFSDRALSAIDRALRETEADARKMTADISVKSEAWEAERDDYRKLALSGREDDFASFDDEATTQAMVRIRDLMCQRLNPILFASRVQEIVIGLIEHSATGHANVCERNGRLEDSEAAARSDVAYDRRVDDVLTGAR